MSFTNKVLGNILGTKPKADRKSRNNIADDWNSMSTSERSLTLANSRAEFIGYLEDAYNEGFLELERLNYYKNNTPKTKNYDKIVEWYYNWGRRN